MKKVLIIVGCVLFWIISMVGALGAGYQTGYDDAMKEVETRVLEGINQMGDLFKFEIDTDGE